MKKTALFALILSLTALMLPASAETNIIRLKVIADAANLREGTGKGTNAVALLEYGAVVTYIENSEKNEILSNIKAPWIKVATKTGKTGYVFGSLLSFESSSDGLAPYIEYSATPIAFSKKEDLEKTPADRRYTYERHWFTKKELALLSVKGFSVAKIETEGYIETDDMVDKYITFSDIRKTEPVIKTYEYDIPTYKQLPLYISSDYMLHCWHLIFDRMLENIETEKLSSALLKLSEMEYKALYQAYLSEKDPELKRIRFTAACYAAVPYAILSGSYNDEGEPAGDGIQKIQDPGIKIVVQNELAFISKTSGPEINFITGGKIDYSQFTVRGHYTHSPELGDYFRAMIWYGTVYFPLKDRPLEGAVIADTFRDKNTAAAWNSVNSVIEKLVGRSDDPGPREYIQAAEKAFGTNKPLSQYPSADQIASYKKEVSLLSHSMIVSSPLANAAGGFDDAKTLDGFRFMGQRFILDSRIFTLLTSPRVGSDTHPRNTPKGLDIFAIYGSPLAESLLKSDFDSIPKFKENYQKARSELKASDRSPTVYELWINLLGYHASAKDKVQQRFTAAKEWEVRKLNTVHGSWAELRHDTILYSKAGCAEMGCGESPEVWIAGTPSIPRGYAEPDPEFFSRLAALTKLLSSSCASENLLTDDYKLKTDQFGEIAQKLTVIAEKEVKRKPISDDDAIYLGALNRTLAEIVMPPHRYSMTTEEKQMALIADVSTDYLTGQKLHVGVGSPRRIRIFVSDASGARVCEGYTFSYYEFNNGTRMTDEEWKMKVYNKDTKQWLEEREPAWTKALPYTD